MDFCDYGLQSLQRFGRIWALLIFSTCLTSVEKWISRHFSLSFWADRIHIQCGPKSKPLKIGLHFAIWGPLELGGLGDVPRSLVRLRIHWLFWVVSVDVNDTILQRVWHVELRSLPSIIQASGYHDMTSSAVVTVSTNDLKAVSRWHGREPSRHSTIPVRTRHNCLLLLVC